VRLSAEGWGDLLHGGGHAARVRPTQADRLRRDLYDVLKAGHPAEYRHRRRRRRRRGSAAAAGLDRGHRSGATGSAAACF